MIHTNGCHGNNSTKLVDLDEVSVTQKPTVEQDYRYLHYLFDFLSVL